MYTRGLSGAAALFVLSGKKKQNSKLDSLFIFILVEKRNSHK